LSKAGTLGESLTYAEVKEILRIQGFGDDLGQMAASLLERIESVKFGGSAEGTTAVKDLYSETKALIRSLSKS
ncbi:MAG: hypothetical protein V3S89_11245, partial [Desulfobacterales bacterium]